MIRLTIGTIALACTTACSGRPAEPASSGPAATPAAAPAATPAADPAAPPATSPAAEPPVDTGAPRTANDLADEIMALERRLDDIVAFGEPESGDNGSGGGRPSAVEVKSNRALSFEDVREETRARLDEALRRFLDVKYAEDQDKVRGIYGPIGMADDDSLQQLIGMYTTPDAGSADTLFGRTLQAASSSGAHVVALVHRERLRPRPDGYLAVRRTVREEASLCPDDVFVRASELSLSRCSGVIIGSDRILTAKHCLTQQFGDDVDQIRVVLDYTAGGPDAPKFPRGHVFSVEVRQRGERDWVILGLKDGQRFPGQRIARREKRQPAEKTHVFAVHHPLGMPRMTSYDATIVRHEGGNFVTNLDVLFGSSGCPVFSAPDGLLVGILINGPQDLVTEKLPDGSECKRVVRRPDPATGADGENVLALHTIAAAFDE